MQTNAPSPYSGKLIQNISEVLWLKQGMKCYWCGRPTRYSVTESFDQATIDHVIPRCAGGPNEQSNMVSACLECNARRNKEYQLGLKEGALMGTFQRGDSHRQRVALTKDEKLALFARRTPPAASEPIPEPPAPPIKPVPPEPLPPLKIAPTRFTRTITEQVIAERDAALRRIGDLTDEVRRLQRQIADLQQPWWRKARYAVGKWLMGEQN